MINYNVYHFSKRELLWTIFKGSVLYSVVLYLFYQEIIFIFLSIPISLFYVKKEKKNRMEERKWQLNLQFKDAVISLSNALSAGYSVENAFKESAEELIPMYGRDSYIVSEFAAIVNQISMNQTIEEILYDFASRSGVEDIENFSEVFITAKRTGGNIIKIIRITAKTMGEKIEVKREIKTMIAAKKLEAGIMSYIPCGILAYLQFFSGNFLEPMYHNFIGRLIMTVLLAVYWGAVKLSVYIMKIDI